MKKAIGIFLVAILAVWLLASFMYKHQSSTAVGSVPTIEQAPYVVQTFVGVYYAVKVSGTPPNIVVNGYYERRENKYVYFKGELRFNKNFGTVTVIRR